MSETATDGAARLLVVDAEPQHRQALCELLRGEGLQVVDCGEEQAALQALGGAPFDLVLVDVALPGGMGLLQRIRAGDGAPACVAMAGRDDAAAAERAVEAGALDHVFRPFRAAALLPVLRRALAWRRLRQASRELELRVQHQAADLEAARRELDAYMRSVCHDLRSPLTGILGFSGILVQEHGEALAPEAMLLLEKIRGSALRLHQLIEDLSRLARFGRHPLNPQPVDVAALVASVGSEMSHHESGREVTLGLGDLPAVTADPTLLRQVFASLLSNAYKFTRGRTPAVVEVGSLVQDGERVWYVRDNGTGFNMAYAGKLFGLFQRMHRADEFEGSGVGLAIAQRIVQRHGGRIWFEAAPQQGASFYFTLSQPA